LRLRIDDLAQQTGIPSGTIRFYQREGLIEAPEREGRVAYYSPAHADRLRRVRALQSQGLPLSLVRDLLAREDAGEDIGGWLALDTAVFGPRGAGAPVDPGALQALGLGDDDVAALERGGVLRRGDDGALTAVPGMLELTARLLDGGVPPDAIRAGSEVIAGRLREVAEAMARLGWDVFAGERERLSADEPVAQEVLDKLEHLRSLAHRIVGTLFAELLDEAIRERSEPLRRGRER
jgi:DNA-binding transcriptional MerR regulator